MADTQKESEIRRYIKKFNESWVNNDLDSLKDLVHNDVVFLAPDLKTSFKGSSSCLKTIEDYNNMATTELFEIKDSRIHLWGDIAAVKVDYYVEYNIENKNYKETGTELWTLIRSGDEKWKMIHRAILNNNPLD